MSESYDVIVVGLGAMGSATAFQLARRGQRVLGLDRFTPPHEFGSSHGETRIIREAYFEHPLYVPLVQRAYELWAQLEKLSGRSLFKQTGGLMIGLENGAIVSGALRSAREHRLAHEQLSAAEVRRRFPALRPTEEQVAVWESRAGALFPEACIEAHLAQSRVHGAELRFGETVLRWEPAAAGVHVITSGGEYVAKRLVLTAGAWVSSLLGEFKFPFRVERQVLYWFEQRAQSPNLDPANCPIFICQNERHGHFYGFPDFGTGVKVARHHAGETANPDALRREVSAEEIALMREIVSEFLAGADGPLRATAVCMYTNTPDEHFLIDWHPQSDRVLIASPCSGHGFKFSAAIGEVVSDLVLDGRSRFDLSLFRLR